MAESSVLRVGKKIRAFFARAGSTEDKEIVVKFSSAQVQRADVPAKFLFAEFLFPRHHRLRYPAPLRHRARQARFHGNAGSTLG
jgi:hypothetical protein